MLTANNVTGPPSVKDNGSHCKLYIVTRSLTGSLSSYALRKNITALSVVWEYNDRPE